MRCIDWLQMAQFLLLASKVSSIFETPTRSETWMRRMNGVGWSTGDRRWSDTVGRGPFWGVEEVVVDISGGLTRGGPRWAEPTSPTIVL